MRDRPIRNGNSSRAPRVKSLLVLWWKSYNALFALKFSWIPQAFRTESFYSCTTVDGILVYRLTCHTHFMKHTFLYSCSPNFRAVNRFATTAARRSTTAGELTRSWQTNCVAKRHIYRNDTCSYPSPLLMESETDHCTILGVSNDASLKKIR
jgi:hypothetical protein